jgi:hypothetical protein
MLLCIAILQSVVELNAIVTSRFSAETARLAANRYQIFSILEKCRFTKSIKSNSYIFTCAEITVSVRVHAVGAF